jgi:hypothetical protein
MNHLQACGHCPKYLRFPAYGEPGCSAYADTTFVNRLGGCPLFPERDLPEAMIKRAGQQKQRHSDRNYSSKNDRRGKFRSVS